MKTIKGMLKVYWMLFIYTGFIIYLIVRQLICECLYLIAGEAVLFVLITIGVFVFTANRRIKINPK